MGVTRREFVELAALTGVALTATGAGTATAQAAPEEARAGSVTVAQGTNIAVAASPDGRWLAFDLYAQLWLLPAAGGTAVRLTDDLQDSTRPCFSPDSRSLVFQSYRDGNFHIWRIELDAAGKPGAATQLTSGRFDHREPRFSPDGKSVVLASDRGGSYGIWRLDPGSGAVTEIIAKPDADRAEPSFTPDGSAVVYTVDATAIDRIALADGAVSRILQPAKDTQVFAPTVGPAGELAYTRLYGAECALVIGGNAVSGTEDVFAHAVNWLSAGTILYAADGGPRRRELATGAVTPIAFQATVPFRPHRPLPAARDIDPQGAQPVRGIASPVLSRDGGQIAFRALNALWTMPVGGKPVKRIADGHFNSDPDFAPNGESLVYSSDREGVPALWTLDLKTGQSTRLSTVPGAQITPRYSPDGGRIAYQDQDGATWVLTVADGSTRKVLPALFQPGRPSWNRDGTVLALAAVRPYSKRYREGTSQILTVNLNTGAVAYTEPRPGGSLSTRGDDGPVWSPDGTRLAFVMDSALWTVTVDGAGVLNSKPVQLTEEATDAPSWGGDQLLYLHNGQLRLIPANGGRARTVPFGLTYTAARGSGRTVIRAGAMWDGTGSSLRRDVDIHLKGNRIEEITARGRGPQAESTVDATKLTVLPGLMDAHVHWHLRGRQWGDRQGRLWLSYGITGVRSPGDPVYQMLETREALQSGDIPGPRMFATGEAVDGTRVYYNFMRPTRDLAQLDREMDRATALDYDLIKTYVRLPVELQRATVNRAHQAGLPLTSHYLFPAVDVGMDGMEHYGATNRLGYSHTVSRLGRAYADATELFGRSGMSITPTLFTSAALLGEDTSLVEDARTRALFPDWEYQALLAKVQTYAGDSPAAQLGRAALPYNVAMMLKIHRAGGLVISGTDAPLDQIGIALHYNLRALVKYGFTPAEALTTATRNPAGWLGVADEIGQVKPGFLADLAIVDGDPLTDIKAAAATRYAVTGGTVHKVDDLVGPATQQRSALAASAEPALADDAHLWWHGESERHLHVCCG
ncbi:amidohydrolase [Pseudonocardiaceae bacterium YIM PH 21723]|nr:amidohydrolase [Pseudonocardiaceae bacterium YIM PH 21723]